MKANKAVFSQYGRESWLMQKRERTLGWTHDAVQTKPTSVEFGLQFLLRLLVEKLQGRRQRFFVAIRDGTGL